jgi:NDP-sugar pyrophosphorylase family protein
MSYRVCIPAAGTGSRLGHLTKFVNKSLVSIANRPMLCHLVEQFPADAEFVIALGHKGHLVREFVELTYPDRKFTFADVQPFEGPGSGLGLSLLACKEFLQQPFVFISCDTLVSEKIPSPDRNWIGYAARVDDARSYRTVAVESGRVSAIVEKNLPGSESRFAYIGLSGIADYRAFWDAMESGGVNAIDTGESHGLRALLAHGINAHAFTWFDTGNPQALARAREAYAEPDAPNILEKGNEAIWFVGKQVVKFSDDEKFISNRVKRVAQLEGFVPEVTVSRPHMYRYSKVEGEVLSDAITLPLFERLLDHCKTFWRRVPLDAEAQIAFRGACRKFYRDKTLERVDLFYKTFNKQDGTQPINGVMMPTLAALLAQVDWDSLSDGVAGRFHGDFHFENILWSEAERRFIFLDWRQDFAGDLEIGDVYYDLAKLLHGLIVNHGLIAQNRYLASWNDSRIDFDLHRRQVLVECERFMGPWLAAAGYDRRKVWELTALIYLNIAALHHHPYSLLLYGLGKSMLMQGTSWGDECSSHGS